MEDEQLKLEVDDYVYQCIECLQVYSVFEKHHINFNLYFCPHCGRNNALKLTLKEDIECY